MILSSNTPKPYMMGMSHNQSSVSTAWLQSPELFYFNGTAMTSAPIKKAKRSVESAYPSPGEELRLANSTSVTAVDHQASSQLNTLPPIKSILDLHQAPSPSVSPRFSDNQNDFESNTLTPLQQKNGTLSSARHAIRDPPLFLEPSVGSISLFPANHADRSQIDRGRPRITPIAPGAGRRRKRTPHQSPEITGPTTKGIGMFARMREDPVAWLEMLREEDAASFGRAGRSSQSKSTLTHPREEYVGSRRSAQLPRLAPAPKRAAEASLPAHPAKRIRADRKNSGDAIEVSYRLALDAASTPRKSSVQSVVKPKKSPKTPLIEQDDKDYEAYPDHTPALSTLDQQDKGFTVAWKGNGHSMVGDPHRHMLHDKEIRLCEKMSLSGARYLYFKRRFFAGFLQNRRINHVYNINAAQQYGKQYDVYNKKGIDVNKIGALHRAFSSVGWLDPAHIDQWVDCQCSLSCRQGLKTN